MVEANPSLARSQRQAQRQAHAVRVLAQQRAREEVKAAIRREGRVKLSAVPARDITGMAEALVIADAAFRAKIIAEATSSAGSGDREEGCGDNIPHSRATTWKVSAVRRGEIQ